MINVSYRFPFDLTAGTVSQFASARPFNATTGIDNNGDRANNDRPVVAGAVAGKLSFGGTNISDVAVFAEQRVRMAGRSLLLRVEGFNVFNHANILARNGTYGNTADPLPTFGQATPGLAAMEPPRMVQFQVRYQF